MYNIGDNVFYPLHGAGTIKSIEERQILDQNEKYYIISMPGEVTIMVPVSNADKLGLREVVSKDEANAILKDLTTETVISNEKWSERYQENKDKLKTGDIEEISDIYKKLSLRNRKKNLSTSEKKMLLNAKQVLFSELSASLDTPYESLETEIETLIDETFNKFSEELED